MMNSGQLSFVLALLGVSCASVSTSFDYDPGTDFEILHTYGWDQSASNAGSDPLVLDRVKYAVEAQLREKGYLAVSANPDFLVSAQTENQQRQQVDFAGWRWGGAYVYTYNEGTLIVDVVDGISRKMIWRGMAEGVTDPDRTPEETTEYVNDAVQKMMKDFPPPKSN